MDNDRDFWEEGRLAYMEGEPLSSCPAGLTEEQEAEWEGGWISAEEDDED